MSKINIIFFLSINFLFVGFVHAQESPVAAGGTATGTGGTVDYSVGQVVYSTYTGNNSYIIQGVQQPYEISRVLGVENQEIGLDIQVYPNPTTNHLTLNSGEAKLSSPTYHLVDNFGKVIEIKKMINPLETIIMENLPSATYFLKVLNGSVEVKIFKIVKN